MFAMGDHCEGDWLLRYVRVVYACLNALSDRCREPGLKWYGVHGHCKHYWSCVMREGGGAYAQSECCPDMGGFVEAEGCVANENCTESCSSPILTGGPKGMFNGL